LDACGNISVSLLFRVFRLWQDLRTRTRMTARQRREEICDGGCTATGWVELLCTPLSTRWGKCSSTIFIRYGATIYNVVIVTLNTFTQARHNIEDFTLFILD
jgi:hypothetical protein